MGRVRVTGVGKAYKRFARKSGRLREWFGLGSHHEDVWVLRDIHLDVAAGEAVGIIGANGAGKSTLLKIITGTVRATTGTVQVAGRIASLLELGIGFDANFSGRENAMLTARLLGLPARRLPELMAEIVDFAELDQRQMDQPLRTYSTGMQVRLAFSVATAVRPDVLIVDEALSVGDVYFQHKSFDRIRRFRDAGTTLLLVSHSAAAIKTLCTRAVLLDHGTLLRDDSPDSVLDYYNALIARQRAEYEIRQTETLAGTTSTRSGNAFATITDIDLLHEGRSVRAVRSGDGVSLRLAIEISSGLPELTAGILIRDRLGNDVFGTNTFHIAAPCGPAAAGDALVVEFTFPRFDLGVGSYSVTAALHTRDTHVVDNFDWWDRALVLQVVQGSRPLSVGVAALEVHGAWRRHVATQPDDATRAAAE